MLAAVDRVLASVTWVIAAFAVIVLLVGPELIAADQPPPTPAAVAQTAANGEQVFTSRCGGCHTLAAAGTSGVTGPNLDALRPDAATVKATVRGGSGTMPSFGDELSNAEIDAVAAYVSAVAGR